ncbi:MAG: hypothetical protein H7A44_04205 [Opitutaceae bacterium]|nr:hypothetical protein [Opitutaceae bacterium]
MKPKLVWVRSTSLNETVHNSRDVGFHRFIADLDAYNAIADAIMHKPRCPLSICTPSR